MSGEDPPAGIGWHRHPGGWWVFGFAAGDGCELCDLADAWAIERAREAPAVAPVEARTDEGARAQARDALRAALAKRRAEQGSLF